MTTEAGICYVVATPIGNLGDLSPRALEVLGAAAFVACEDTRRTRQLLTRAGLKKRLVSLHEHNEQERIEQVVTTLRAGSHVALVSDAGTPLVSDPGYRLLAALREARLPVSPVPGPSAVMAALSVAGLPTDRFLFEGFLPARRAARRRRLEALAAQTPTLVFFEAVHRMADCLADMAELLGEDRPGTLCRELTKQHETIYRDELAGLRRQLAEDPGGGRGEFTLVVAGAPATAPDQAELERVLGLLAAELPPARAAALAARITGARRQDAYRLARLLPGK